MATQGRIPIPKTQAEIADSFITPFDSTRGNPNQPQDLIGAIKPLLETIHLSPFQ